MIVLSLFEICLRLFVVSNFLSIGHGEVDITSDHRSAIGQIPVIADNKTIECGPCNPLECGTTHILFEWSNITLLDHGLMIDNYTHSKLDKPLTGIPRLDCDINGSFVLDACNCCVICVRKAADICGGIAHKYGVCESGSICWPRIPPKGKLLTGSETGLCIETSDVDCVTPIESIGCNLHAKHGCICANISACGVVNFQYSTERECHEDWKKLQEMWQEDCSKVKCDIVFQPECPPDSVLIPAPPPEPPDCCQKIGTCVCSFSDCPSHYNELKTCPHGSDLVLTVKATGEPGSCCDMYECLAVTGDHCSGVICPRQVEPGLDEFDDVADGKQDGCPFDSFRPLAVKGKDVCCPISDECRCRPGICKPVDCANNQRAIIRKRGSGIPGSCCDESECLEIESTSEIRPLKCEYEGTSYPAGAIWRPSVCTECSCKDGVNLCRKLECASSTCTRLAIPEGECCPVCIGCTTEDGDVHNFNDEWQKDDCTTCMCDQYGQILCQKQLCKVECDHPVKIPGECCPKCEKPLIITLPQICPSIELCPLRCEYGLKRNDRGCFLCECQTDSFAFERDHYDKASINELTKPQSSLKHNCSSFDGSTCLKKCAHGYQHDDYGCPLCKCKACPSMSQCYKHCVYGFQKNKYGCVICKCKESDVNLTSPFWLNSHQAVSQGSDLSSSSSDLLACHLQTGEVRDHGEWWFDGCRHCYCDDGNEFCSLLVCPPLNCTDPVYESGECCPRCPESSQNILVQRIVCYAPGSGRSYVEGEFWNLNTCISCTCHVGHVLCHKKPCAPTPCHNAVLLDGHCCPVCEHQSVPESTSSSNVTFCQGNTLQSAFADGTIWKSTPCESCMCHDSKISCYNQLCPLTGCAGRLLQVKYDCCSVCAENLDNGACKFSDSVVYSVGERWRDGPCRNCSCFGDGETRCTQVECPRCLNPAPVSGQCCPQCNNDNEKYGGDGFNWTTWEPAQASTTGTSVPELPRAEISNPNTSIILLSSLAGAFVLFAVIILLVFWYRKRFGHNSHQGKGALGFLRNGDTNGGARLTNFPGYDPTKAVPAIIDVRSQLREEQTKSLLNPSMNIDVDGRKNYHNSGDDDHHPDILLSGNDCNIDCPYDERHSRAVKNGTLLYNNYDLDGWGVEKV